MMRLSHGTTKKDSFRHNGHMRKLTLSCCSFCFLHDRMQLRQNAQAQFSSIPNFSPLLRMLSKQIPHSASSPALALRDHRSSLARCSSCGLCDPLAADGGGGNGGKPPTRSKGSSLSMSTSCELIPPAADWDDTAGSPSNWATSTTCRLRHESPKLHEPFRKNLHTLRLPLLSAALTARRAGLALPVGCISFCQYLRISTSL
mmetsp:Transcript_63958/g.128333  ORF Transcript_63958/g.128333 Transcript_63958/m.128333 type:complete len:202 (-) Transcript_63958:142-747(-)